MAADVVDEEECVVGGEIQRNLPAVLRDRPPPAGHPVPARVVEQTPGVGQPVLHPPGIDPVDVDAGEGHAAPAERLGFGPVGGVRLQPRDQQAAGVVGRDPAVEGRVASDPVPDESVHGGDVLVRRVAERPRPADEGHVQPRAAPGFGIAQLGGVPAAQLLLLLDRCLLAGCAHEVVEVVLGQPVEFSGDVALLGEDPAQPERIAVQQVVEIDLYAGGSFLHRLEGRRGDRVRSGPAVDDLVDLDAVPLAVDPGEADVGHGGLLAGLRQEDLGQGGLLLLPSEPHHARQRDLPRPNDLVEQVRVHRVAEETGGLEARRSGNDADEVVVVVPDVVLEPPGEGSVGILAGLDDPGVVGAASARGADRLQLGVPVLVPGEHEVGIGEAAGGGVHRAAVERRLRDVVGSDGPQDVLDGAIARLLDVLERAEACLALDGAAGGPVRGLVHGGRAHGGLSAS